MVSEANRYEKREAENHRLESQKHAENAEKVRFQHCPRLVLHKGVKSVALAALHSAVRCPERPDEHVVNISLVNLEAQVETINIISVSYWLVWARIRLF